LSFGFVISDEESYVAANFDTSVIFTSFRGDGAPKQSSQPEAQALSLALDFLAETASGVPWRDAIKNILEMLSQDPATTRFLPVALLDCRVASIRSYKFSELPDGLLAAFDAAIALLISGQTEYDEEYVQALLNPIIAHPEHPPLEGLEALLNHLEPRLTSADPPDGISQTLEVLRAKFAEVDGDAAIQKRLKGLLEVDPPVRRTTLNIKVPPKKKRQVRVEAPRPSAKWLRNVESLLDSMGEDRVRITAKRAFCSFMSADNPKANESLLGYAWISERLCDEELVEILAEVARRCLDSDVSTETYDLGMAAAGALARQNCDHSRDWLDWILEQIDDPEVVDDVREMYSHRSESESPED
jgi:hypothetical protein